MMIKGNDLSIRDSGGHGIPVLLIHGGLFKDLLLPLERALNTTGEFRVITYERRGYGRREAVALDMKGQAADGSEVLRQLGIRKAHVFGHSIGGSIALQFAQQAPEQVTSLSLGEPDIPWHHVPSGAAIQEGYKQLAEMYEQESKMDVLSAIMSELHGPDYMDIFPADMLALGADDMSVFFKSEYPAFLDWQFESDDVNKFKMPVQFICGENTAETAKEMGDILQQWNGKITRVEIPGSTHTFPWTHPYETAEAITTFVRRAASVAA